MANTSIFTRELKGKGKLSVYVRYKVNSNIDFKTSLGIKVSIKDWDIDKQRVRKIITLPHQDYNELISAILRHFESFTTNNLSKGIIPSLEAIKTHYETFFTLPEPKKEIELFEFIEIFIDKAVKEPNPHTRKLVKLGTLKSYEVTRNLLKRFNDEVYKLTFDKITIDWYNDFVEWCYSLNFTSNYIGKNIQVLKSFLRRANELNYTNNRVYEDSRFIVLKEDVDNIYLTEEEILKIYNLDLSKQPKHEQARDIFLIGCKTGLRISDFNRLKTSNIETVSGVEMFKIKTEKTQRVVALPIHPMVKQIMKRYDNQPPNKMYDQDINNLIKEVGEWCGIDKDEYITKTIGGKTVKKKYLRYELISSHTARRSFCTNAYLSNVDTLDIMALSGHTSEKNFLNYIKVTPEQVAIRMSKHPYFNNFNNEQDTL